MAKITINGISIEPAAQQPVLEAANVGTPPDISQGFGRVNLLRTVDPGSQGKTVKFFDENTILHSGQEESLFQDTVGKAAKVTLTWTDPAGRGSAERSRLDHSKCCGARMAWNMPAGSSDFDRTNNVEQVIWQTATPDNISIIVRCFRATVPQNYALVVRIQS